MKATANLTLSGETEGFPLGCRTRCRDPLGLIRVHTKLDILLRVVRQENRRKGLQIKMKDENHFCLQTTWSCILKILKKSLKETQLKINRASEVGGGSQSAMLQEVCRVSGLGGRISCLPRVTGAAFPRSGLPSLWNEIVQTYKDSFCLSVSGSPAPASSPFVKRLKDYILISCVSCELCQPSQSAARV